MSICIPIQRQWLRAVRAGALAVALALVTGCGGDSDAGGFNDQPLNAGGMPGGVPVGPFGPFNGVSGDLTVIDMVAPNVVLSGGSLLLQVTVGNPDVGTMPRGVPWLLYRDTGAGLIPLEQGNLPRLQGGEQVDVDVVIDTRGLPLGDLALCFVIDPNNIQQESDETNNDDTVIVNLVPNSNG